MIIIIVLLVLLLGAVAYISFFVLKLSDKNPNESGSTAPQSVSLTVDQIEKVPLSSPISTNLFNSDDGVEHYVKINLSIGVNNTDKKESPKMVESLTKNEMVTRDIVLSILRGHTYEDLSLPEGQELLKDGIRSRLQEEYGSNLIVQVYISDLAFS
jgi:flagellar basal body-associated protein FliL